MAKFYVSYSKVQHVIALSVFTKIWLGDKFTLLNLPKISEFCVMCVSPQSNALITWNARQKMETQTQLLSPLMKTISRFFVSCNQRITTNGKKLMTKPFQMG